MNPSRVRRDQLEDLTDLPNIGPRIASLLVSAGIDRPEDLKAWDGLDLYKALCSVRNARLDPCVLDVCLSITRFVQGEMPQPWWAFTAERKRRYPDI
jgi:hypothetical protein